MDKRNHIIHVTGAQGLLGQELVRAMSTLGAVVGSDVADMDITQPDTVLRVLTAQRPTIMVHAAALKGNNPSKERPLDFFAVNTTGTLHILEACRKLQVEHVIFISSMTVHGPVGHELVEDEPNKPIHPYGGSKGAAEAMVEAYCRAYGMRATMLRPNFIVGPIHPPTPYTDNLIYRFMQTLDADDTIRLAGDGSFAREWVHPRDVAAAAVLAAQRPPDVCEAYLLGGNRATMIELCTKIRDRVGRGAVSTDPTQGGFSLISSHGKAQRDLGWEPQVTLDAIIDEMWHEYQGRHVATSDIHHGH
jgi:UDP-glucose 4-epimerase